MPLSRPKGRESGLKPDILCLPGSNVFSCSFLKLDVAECAVDRDLKKLPISRHGRYETPEESHSGKA
jgi:hypothetical protein